MFIVKAMLCRDVENEFRASLLSVKHANEKTEREREREREREKERAPCGIFAARSIKEDPAHSADSSMISGANFAFLVTSGKVWLRGWETERVWIYVCMNLGRQQGGVPASISVIMRRMRGREAADCHERPKAASFPRDPFNNAALTSLRAKRPPA